MAGQLMTRDAKVATIRDLLAKSRKQIEMALPKHLTPDRLMRIAMTSIQRTPALLECQPTSLVAAVIEAAQLGLEPDGMLGHAYLVPYKTKHGARAVLIPGYRGLIELARRSGQIREFYAYCVYENDEFEYTLGLERKIVHKPAQKDRGKFVAAYAVAIFKDGGYDFEVMTKEEIDAIRKRSMAANAGPWVTDYTEMARKTVIRRLAKRLPASPELARAVALDEQADRGEPQAFSVDVDALESVTALPDGVKDAEIEPEDEPEPKPKRTRRPKSLDEAVAEAETATQKVSCPDKDGKTVEALFCNEQCALREGCPAWD